MAKAKVWAFTLNNYTDEEQVALRVVASDRGCVRFMIFGREVGEQNTPHLQGCVGFVDRKRANQVKVLLGSDRFHVEVARNIVGAYEYCKKDGDFECFGDLTSSGKRSDLDLFKDEVKSGVLDPVVLRERHSVVYARYRHFFNQYIYDCTPRPVVTPFPLRVWQQELWNYLILPPVDRKIVFIVDHIGNQGKSWFAHYYEGLHERTQILIPGKKMDMAAVLNPTCRVLFLDAPRSKQGEFLQYDFLEEVKNGYVAAYKYESCIKRMQPCHVVVLMNEEPDMTKLSDDRYDIRIIS